MNKITIYYISNYGGGDSNVIRHGHDAHFRYTLKSFRQSENAIFVDSDFFKINQRKLGNKNLSQNKTLILFRIIAFLVQIIKMFFKAKKTRNIIKKIRANLIYERTEILSYYFLTKNFKRKFGLISFLEVHAPIEECRNYIKNPLVYLFVKYIEKCKYLQADRIFTVSNSLKEYLIQKFRIDNNKISVMHNGVDKEVFFEDINLRKETRKILCLDEKIIVGFVGSSNIPWHNLNLLVDAMGESIDLKDLHLLLVGIEKSDIIRNRQYLFNLNFVTCLGRVSPEKVNNYINAMDICVLPGTNWYCSPMKLFEYGAVGKPIITVDMPNVREIVSSNNFAIFFKMGDSADLADKIKLLYNDKDLRKKIGDNFRTHVLNTFGWNKNVQKIIDVYKEYLPKKEIVILRKSD